MRTLVHLSDLHFGRVDERLLVPITQAIHALTPDLVVVSGDLTQRARSSQFAQARRFLDGLPQPQVVVPGNHDVPLYNVFKRFFDPLDNFRRHIDADVEPSYIDEEIAVVGVNTARSMTLKNGRINVAQVERIRRHFLQLDDSTTRILVTHHPFDLADGVDDKHLLGRSVMAMKGLAEFGVDLLLSGHLHATHSMDTSARHPIEGFSALVVQAGTATSTRGRDETNSFNVLRIANPLIVVERHAWDEDKAAYLVADRTEFRRRGRDWSPA